MVTDPKLVSRDSELDEELAGILTAISVVSKRLAKKLRALEQTENLGNGGKAHDGYSHDGKQT